METQTILEDNKLIAEFMELPFDEARQTYFINPEYGDTWVTADKLGYKDSWNSLMPVVKKCGDVIHQSGYDFESPEYEKWEELFGDHLYGSFLDNSIDEVFETVVDFIKWYNNNNQK